MGQCRRTRVPECGTGARQQWRRLCDDGASRYVQVFKILRKTVLHEKCGNVQAINGLQIRVAQKQVDFVHASVRHTLENCVECNVLVRRHSLQIVGRTLARSVHATYAALDRHGRLGGNVFCDRKHPVQTHLIRVAPVDVQNLDLYLNAVFVPPDVADLRKSWLLSSKTRQNTSMSTCRMRGKPGQAVATLS